MARGAGRRHLSASSRRRQDTAHEPALELLDARADGLDEEGLRTRARAAGLQSGWTSRSYCFPYALVASHTDRVGVDVERIVACDEGFARSITTPQEQRHAMPVGDEEIISLWCSKEALAKALGDAVRYDPRRLESPRSWAGGANGLWRARPVEVPRGYCAWVCWREAGLQRPR